jgi:hypothetical protein
MAHIQGQWEITPPTLQALTMLTSTPPPPSQSTSPINLDSLPGRALSIDCHGNGLMRPQNYYLSSVHCAVRSPQYKKGFHP